MKPTRAQLKQLERDNLKYGDRLELIPQEDWPMLPSFASGSIARRCLRSRKFLLVEWTEPNGYLRLSVNRTDWDHRQGRFRDDISWDDLQRLKDEAGHEEVCAVEVYPPTDRVVNVANMRHLFILPEIPEYMW